MDKKYLKQVALYVLTAVVSVCLILYVGYHLFYGLTQKVETAPALTETVISTLKTDVYIFRDEIPLTAAAGASRIPAVEDGTRVGVEDVVSRLYDVSSPDIVAAIEELDMQLRVLSQMQNSTLSARDTVSIDSGIYGIMQKIAAAGQSGDCGNIASLRASLISEMNRRAIVTGSASDVSGAAARLNEEKKALTARLGVCRETVRTPYSGYYYAACDGYETVFSADCALSMSPGDFQTLVSSAQAAADMGNAGKIAVSYEWYAACVIDAAEAAGFTEGEEYAVTFPYNGDVSVTMRLERVQTEGEDTLLVFRCGELPPGFRFTRTQPAVVAIRESTGLRIPVSAIRTSDGVPVVYIRRGSVIHYRAVRILLEKEDWCLVEIAPEEDPPQGYTWLSRNDIVITKGRGLYEGRILP